VQGSSCKTSLRTWMETGAWRQDTAPVAPQLPQKGRFPSMSRWESEQEFCRRLHRSGGDEPFPGKLGATAPALPWLGPGLLRAWFGVPHRCHGQMCPASRGGRGDAGLERAAEPPLRRSRRGGSCAQRWSKALIAISRHSAFFSVQFVLEASIVSEAK